MMRLRFFGSVLEGNLFLLRIFERAQLFHCLDQLGSSRLVRPGLRAFVNIKMFRYFKLFSGAGRWVGVCCVWWESSWVTGCFRLLLALVEQGFCLG